MSKTPFGVFRDSISEDLAELNNAVYKDTVGKPSIDLIELLQLYTPYIHVNYREGVYNYFLPRSSAMPSFEAGEP